MSKASEWEKVYSMRPGIVIKNEKDLGYLTGAQVSDDGHCIIFIGQSELMIPKTHVIKLANWIIYPFGGDNEASGS